MVHDDSDIVPNSFLSLLDAEAAPTGDRLAVVRGDHQEEIAVLKMNGPPPNKPTVANGQCASLGPPTASSSTRRGPATAGCWPGRRTTASGSDRSRRPVELRRLRPVRPAHSGRQKSRLQSGGDHSRPPAVMRQPGQPLDRRLASRAAPTPCGSCRQSADAAIARHALAGFAKDVAGGLTRLRIRGLLRRRQLTVEFTAPGPGLLAVQLEAASSAGTRATVLATGRRACTASGKARVVIKLTAKGRKHLRRTRRFTATLEVSFTPRDAKMIQMTSRVQLRR